MTNDTSAFVAAPLGCTVPVGTFLVDPVQFSIEDFNGSGVLKYTTDASENQVGLTTKGTVHISTRAAVDNGAGDVPHVTADGAINIENGQLKFFCDLDDDGDYDADLWAGGNMYLAAVSRMHLRTQIPESGGAGTDEGRLVIGATDDTNYIQSAKKFSGSVIKDLAFGGYNNSDWWMCFDESSGGYCGIGVSDDEPIARLHVADTSTTVAVFENETSTTGYTRATVGVDTSDRLVLRGEGADVPKLSALNVQAGGASVELGSGSFPFTGAVLKSDDGTAYRLTVSNAGALVITAA